MSFANDVSYLIDNKIIVLAEHQSTVNPNMITIPILQSKEKKV